MTPYLGGAAVMFGFTVAAVVFGDGATDLFAITGCALALFAVGTVDDRIGLGIFIRLSGHEPSAESSSFAADLGWAVFDSEFANLASRSSSSPGS